MTKPADPLRWWANVVTPVGSLAAGRGPGSAERYLAFPRREQPSFLIDPSLDGAVVDAIGRTGAGVSQGKRLARKLAASVASIERVRQYLPNTVHVVAPSGAPNLRSMLGEHLGTEVRLSISAGPVRPNRKPVVRVFDAAEELIAFAKVGWDGPTAALIATEAEALAQLGATPCAGLIVPGSIWSGIWQGHQLLLTTPLPVDHRESTDQRPDVEIESLQNLTEHFPRTVSTLSASDYWGRVSARLGSAPDGPQIIDDVATLAGSTPLSFGAFHGDWSPWNIRRGPDQQLYVWDWERFAPDAPVGLDAAHHHFQVLRFLEKRSLAETIAPVVARLAPNLADLAVDADNARIIVALELVETLARMTESGVAEQLAESRADLVTGLRTMLASGSGQVL